MHQILWPFRHPRLVLAVLVVAVSAIVPLTHKPKTVLADLPNDEFKSVQYWGGGWHATGNASPMDSAATPKPRASNMPPSNAYDGNYFGSRSQNWCWGKYDLGYCDSFPSGDLTSTSAKWLSLDSWSSVPGWTATGWGTPDVGGSSSIGDTQYLCSGSCGTDYAGGGKAFKYNRTLSLSRDRWLINSVDFYYQGSAWAGAVLDKGTYFPACRSGEFENGFVMHFMSTEDSTNDPSRQGNFIHQHCMSPPDTINTDIYNDNKLGSEMVKQMQSFSGSSDYIAMEAISRITNPSLTPRPSNHPSLAYKITVGYKAPDCVGDGTSGKDPDGQPYDYTVQAGKLKTITVTGAKYAMFLVADPGSNNILSPGSYYSPTKGIPLDGSYSFTVKYSKSGEAKIDIHQKSANDVDGGSDDHYSIFHCRVKVTPPPLASCSVTGVSPASPYIGQGVTITVSLKNASAAGGPNFDSSYVLKQASSDGMTNHANVSGILYRGDSQNLTYDIQPRGSPILVTFAYRLYDGDGDLVAGSSNNGDPLCSKTVTWLPPTLTCGALNASTDAIETETPFTIAPSVNLVNWYIAAPLPPAYHMTLAVDIYNNANQLHTANTSQAWVSPPQIITINATGTYTVKWQLLGTYPSPLCSGQIKVYSLPYFGVYNGDVRAGAAFTNNDTCGTPPSGYKGIAAFNHGSDSNPARNYAGSGADVAAIATDKIYGFASANKRAGPTPPKGLTFSNYNNISGDSEYGGGFSSYSCIGDYWDLSKYSAAPVITGSYTLPDHSNFTGKQDVFIKNGNVYINNNVQYTGSSWSVDNIPYFRLIVYGGNIYIKNTVAQLDGLYVAIPDSSGNGGTIYTCTTTAAPPNATTVATSCNQPLTVYGAFIANKVKLLRTWGTLHDANVADDRNNPHAAEKFIYTPELWLGTPATSLPNGYNAITSLPPIL